MLRALGAAGASRILVRSSTRTEYPQEVGFAPLARAKQAPACSVVAMITEDRGTAVWSLAGGTAGKRGKGMAGPDLTLAGEQSLARKRCPRSVGVAGSTGSFGSCTILLTRPNVTEGILLRSGARRHGTGSGPRRRTRPLSSLS